MTDRQTLALAGAFYLLAFPLFGGGQMLMQSTQPTIGLGLVVANSAVVIAIGVLLAAIVRRTSSGVAAIVFWGRFAEAVILAAGAVGYMLQAGDETGQTLNETGYHVAMIVLAVEGVVFSLWMFRERRIPPAFAALGVVGYIALTTAMILDRLGFGAFSAGFLAVAGAFEISFAFWLMLLGFRQPAAALAA